ncbi:hypothetical protein AA103587_1089 [Gluconobacter kanchanaburiensis NBRC 103587]|nr:hypothetical protein AA103587_1089 [Gluconobacter kanchanaburiensis NBRC 103587]
MENEMFNFQVRMLTILKGTNEKSERLLTVKAENSSEALKFAQSRAESMSGVIKASPIFCKKSN